MAEPRETQEPPTTAKEPAKPAAEKPSGEAKDAREKGQAVEPEQ